MPDYTLRLEWDRRYARGGRRGPGTLAHTDAGNAQFYRAKYDAIDRCLRAVGTSLENRRVLDAAGGTGEFVPYFLARGCSSVTISDYSEVAVDIVQRRWAKEQRVDAYVADLTRCSPYLTSVPYDFVFVQEAIFLIPGDEDWTDAVANLCSYVKFGGYLIISDVFPPQREMASAYVVRRSRREFEDHLSRASFSVLAYVRQSVLFNRRLVGRAQVVIEHLGSLYYWLDRLAARLGCAPPPHLDIQYLVARKEV
jgi:2-polyprenyl-3-methyl-5-hydroxy-6-metoxy-1,4-benzoquinol methylase